MGGDQTESYELHDYEEDVPEDNDNEYIDHSFPEYNYGDLDEGAETEDKDCYKTYPNCDGHCPDKYVEIRYIYVPGE